MTIFISQPMSSKTHEEILECQEQTTKKIKNLFGEDTVVIDSYTPYTADTIDEIPEHLRLLAKAINKLADADGAYFTKGWEKSRGCRIEHECCKLYELEIYYEK